MGWNLSVLHATGPAAASDAFALANGYRPDVAVSLATFGEIVASPDTGDVARPALAVADVATGLLLAAPLLLSHDWGIGLSAKNGTATWATWQSTTGTYAFAHYRDGRLVRELVRKDGALQHDDGSPLGPEALLRWNDPGGARGADDADDLHALFSQLTGLTDPDRWMAAPARRYVPVPSSELGPIKKKRLFRR